MKRCPECRRDYTDETLNFCLDDGAALLDGPGSQVVAGDAKTEILPAGYAVRDNPTIVQENPTKMIGGDLTAVHTSDPGIRVTPKAIAGVVLLTGAIAIAAYWFLGRSDSTPPTLPQPKLTQLTFADGIEEYPTWSPDGSSVAYSGEVGGVRKIFLKNLATGDERQITRGSEDDIQAAFSSDGTKLLFVRAQKPLEKLQPVDVFGSFEGGDIWSVELQSGQETKIIDGAYNPAISPDGKSFAYDSSRSGPRRIWLYDAS